MVVDSEVYTDLDPVQAPLWVVHLVLNDEVPSLLIKSLCSLLDMCGSFESTEQLLGKNYTVLQSPGITQLECIRRTFFHIFVIFRPLQIVPSMSEL